MSLVTAGDMGIVRACIKVECILYLRSYIHCTMYIHIVRIFTCVLHIIFILYRFIDRQAYIYIHRSICCICIYIYTYTVIHIYIYYVRMEGM